MHERPTLDQLIPTEPSFAEKRVENARERLLTSSTTRTRTMYDHIGNGTKTAAELKAANVELQRAALAYAAAKLAETGESGVMNAITLLNQISEGVAK